jgi:pimeloyl-ACP methyl ester carboxylesterase
MQHRERLQKWQEEGKWHKYKGYSIFCQMAGTGEPLVLIHGFPTASWDWKGVWADLASKYQVITFDMIGFGFSDKPTEYAYSIVDQANLVESILQEIGIRKCHLLCHDYGDSVGQELLARQREGSAKVHIETICFLNGGLFPEVHQPALIQKLLLSAVGPFVSRLITRRMFDLNMQHIFGSLTQPTDRQLEEFWQLLEYNDGRAIMHRHIKYLEERRCLRQRWVAPMLRGGIPMAFINGVDDPIAGASMVARYKALVVKPYVLELAGVGHYPQVELPGEVVAGYLQFRERFSMAVAH